MAKIQRPEWTTEEENQLVEIVLQNLREGHTLVAAFREAEPKLKRPYSGLNFRWHHELKQRYTKEIEEAKRYAIRAKKEDNLFSDTPETTSQVEQPQDEKKEIVRIPIKINKTPSIPEAIEEFKKEVKQEVLSEHEVTAETVYNDIKKLLSQVDQSKNVYEENQQLKATIQQLTDENDTLKDENKILKDQNDNLTAQVAKIQDILGPLMQSMNS